jgi:PelA/Pel-15E family pectate lyase
MRENGINEPTMPPPGRSVRSIPLGRPTDWYGDTEAKKIADIILSFQTPAGGWSKNLDMSQHRRGPGERFAAENASLHPSDADFDTPHDILWNYVGTFDNDATITQLRFLSKVIAAADTERGVAYRAAFLHGIDYIFAAQYPNGGWPQVWPLQGGYHDTITFNDDAMTNILELLRDISQGTNEFAFVPQATREQAAESIERGIKCILAAQIRVNWRRTVWCQQHDALTLEPASARNYEMPCQCSGESARIMLFLMQQPRPNLAIVDAVHAAAAWFEKTKLKDVAFRWTEEGGRRLVPSPGSPPLWARYYEIGTDRPIFGDRDKTIHDRIEEISLERRRGYAWYVSTPAEALEKYAEWIKIHPPRSQGPTYVPRPAPYFKPTVKTGSMPPA